MISKFAVIVMSCILVSAVALAPLEARRLSRVPCQQELLTGRAGDGTIDLRLVQASGVKVLANYTGEPDKHGVFETYSFELPEIEVATYYRSMWWPASGNRVRPIVMEDFSAVPEGGIFILLKLKEQQYMAILPIAGPIAYSWFHADNGRLQLKMGTHGKDVIKGDIPLYAWARGANPYEACYRAWKEAQNYAPIRGAALMREAKKYPEPFKYLGWCSWEHYRGKISAENMVGAMKDIEKSDIPIRFFLIDNGHFDSSSLKAHPQKFPNGYKPLTEVCKEDKIKWFGIWYAHLGTKYGVHSPGNLGEVGKYMTTTSSGTLLPSPTEQAGRAFFEYLFSSGKADGADFVKVDFSSYAINYYAGAKKSEIMKGLPTDNSEACGNPYAGAVSLINALEDVTDEQWNGLMQCNWQTAANLFSMKNSVVARCSEDYKVGDLARAKSHLYHSYAAMPWLGQIAWGDHDMFHSNDEVAGRMMAVSKAISGGPAYLSDKPQHFAPENVWPLCYKDGLLLRPVAPPAPLADSLFTDPLSEDKAYKVVAPLANRTAAVVVYNLTKQDVPVKAIITAADYENATGMIQPYPGKWEVPAGGLIVYDWYAGKAERLGAEYAFELKGFSDRLLHLCPVRNGWAVIGRTDKYLSSAAVEVVKNTAEELTIRMIKSGPLGVWSDSGVPSAKDVSFEDKGNGFWEADIEPGHQDMLITIRKRPISAD